MKSSKIKHIALLIAMQDEAKPIIDRLNLAAEQFQLQTNRPNRLYRGCFASMEISLILNGVDSRYNADLIGPVATTLSTTSICEIIQPDLVISCGTAGGFSKRGASIGSIYLSYPKCIFHDRIVPLPGFDESGIGHFPVLDIRKMAKQLGFGIGVVSSGSSLKKRDEDITILKQNLAVAKEMEAAAAAWVCDQNNTPFFALKSITNILDEDNASEEAFIQNFDRACQSLTEALDKVLIYCSSRKLSELGFD